MLPCADVHWKILPAICREIAVGMEKEGATRGRIAAALGTTGAAVSQYISGKRGGEKLNAKAVAACRKLAKKMAGRGVDRAETDLEVSRIIVIAKRSKLGRRDPCAICMSHS
jgi:predicted transcriptional regulator